MKKILQRIFYASLLLAAAWVAWNYQLVVYGCAQGYGQLSIIWNTKPTIEVLEDGTVADSIKSKIKLIDEIRAFAFDSLGIKRNKNYTTYYDQKGKPLLWVVTASPPFQMKAYEWDFPILGKVSYKGFFDYEKAIAEEQQLAAQGYDTEIGEVSAWSTLGWLKDPILSSMCKRKPGSLANLIIHELTHGTLYVKNNVDFNENLASFVGDYGARKFLIQKYGVDATELKEYDKGLLFHREYSELALHWSKKIDSLYKNFPTNFTVAQKQSQKNSLIAAAKNDLTVFLKAKKYYSKNYEKIILKLNNAYFIDYIMYRSQQNIFENEFRTKFNSHFPSYMKYLKEKYPTL